MSLSPESSPELQKLHLTLQYFDKYTLLNDLSKLRKHVKSVLLGKLFHTLITLALTKLCLAVLLHLYLSNTCF